MLCALKPRPACNHRTRVTWQMKRRRREDERATLSSLPCRWIAFPHAVWRRVFFLLVCLFLGLFEMAPVRGGHLVYSEHFFGDSPPGDWPFFFPPPSPSFLFPPHFPPLF